MHSRQSTAKWLARFKSLLPGLSGSTRRRPPSAPLGPAQPSASASAAPSFSISGKEQGWLRVLQADELIDLVQAQKAVRQMLQQSRLAEVVFRRDLLPAIHRYAEYVQLMPASEAHHHAHAGGLLAHTLEMVLAAMTWRNAHFLPTNASVEQIDAERDQWTYVVFYAALLYDIAKPMTDLRILWRSGTMIEPIRWKPIAGSLSEVGDGRANMEYRVEFEPKTARDYQAHSKLALTLLSQIAPSSALTFLARTPHAFDALSQYLAGNKVGLLADIVKRADQASTSNALLKGSKARFATANAVPLVDLLMQALKSMLQASTELPLNRSGAAGWVFDGSIWFVAKRLADTTRAWIKTHAPEEAIPGEAKNDRLFDTWQEYGILQVNPQTGQAIWHVEVIGEAPQDGMEEEGSAEAPGAGHQYTHALSMLRFPLDKLYDDAGMFPPAMAGKIIVKAKRGAAESEDEVSPSVGQAESAAGSFTRKADSVVPTQAGSAPASAEYASENGPVSAVAAAKPNQAAKPKGQAVPEPKFNKPKLPQASGPRTGKPSEPAPAASSSAAAGTKNAAMAVSGIPTDQQSARSIQPSYVSEPVFPPLEDAIDGFDIDDDSFLDADDSASRAAAKKPKPVTAPRAKPKNAAISAPQVGRQAAATGDLAAPKEAVRSSIQETAAEAKRTNDRDYVKFNEASKVGALPSLNTEENAENIHISDHSATRSNRLFSKASTPGSMATTPVVLTPALPELPHETAAKKKEPSAAAMEFIGWLQLGLANREIKYNESGAPVHFVEEGMALVSPLIFKLYARETGPEEHADATGMQVQREVIKSGWHRMGIGSGVGKVNILRYQVIGRGNTPVARLSAVVLVDPDRFVLPVPPANPVLKLESE